MRKVSYLVLVAMVAFASCKQGFKKAKDGTEYQIFPSKGGKLVSSGNVIELNVLATYKDSTTHKDTVLFNTAETAAPQFIPYDTAQLPPLYKEVFKNLHVGDSIVMKLSTDTIMKQQGQLPAFMQRHQYVIQSFKIVNAFATQQEADSARKIVMGNAEVIAKGKAAEQLKKDDKTLTDYFAKNNIKAVKAPEGTYVEIITAGTGSNLDTSMVATANYTGRILGVSKPFDSNTDPVRGHMEPLPVNMTTDPSLGQPLIKGMTDGFTLLNKGAKARLYIPSPLGYGPQAGGPDLPGNSILVFDIDVLSVMNKAEAKADIAAKQMKMQEMQKRYMDSVKKAMPDTTRK